MKESDADMRLRERDASTWPSKPAFGGRKMGKTELGLRKREWVILSGVCLLAAGVRLYRLDYPHSVV